MATTTHREIERKYEATPTTELPSWSSVFDAEPVVHEQQLLATYLDTADLRLAGARITLRYRTGDDATGWHLKLPAGKDTRDEIQVRAEARDEPGPPPGELAELLRTITRDAPLQPIAELRTARRVLRWTDPAGRDLLDVTDDHVTARVLPDGPEHSWREIEVELGAEGDLRLLKKADAVLRRSGVQRSSSASKLARALGDRAPEQPKPVRAEATAGEVVVAYLRDQAAAIRRYDVEVRRDSEDAVHQLRVATRRARSALQAYGKLIDREQTRQLTDELKWLAGVAGPARDLEVLRARFGVAVQKQPVENVLGPVQPRLAAWFAPRQAEARTSLLRTLDSARYHALLDALDAVVADPPLTARAGRPAAKELPRQLARSFSRMQTHMDVADQHRGVERDVELHEGRKAAKRLRYATEGAEPVLGRDARKLISHTKKVQEVLGEHQDAVVAAPVLRELAIAAAGGGESSFTWGLLYGLEICTGVDEAALDPAWAGLRKAANKVCG
ncbi:CYTH and CHAD domain-containing protein [Sporichthya sp.]|uniref:CYTH and CHAD domain-containing protein n=1 Tax=Sporichthya sp. TaxID=65475 RepID=UPI00181F17B2|nr:CYTH and CHAD domain-containing protein [Sporichthya sp.]MBA3742285.1 CYTH and CHAD domain-containing protein [Sporichthya sp.]